MRLWFLPLLALSLAAQTPSFEVASIRPANRTITGLPPCGRVDASPETVLTIDLASSVLRLDNLISDAYRDEVDDFDFPRWIPNNGTLAVSVKIPANTTVRMCRKMLQNLLAERFHLVIGVETRDVARYYLKVAKSGLKLKPVETPSTDPSFGYSFNVKDGFLRHTFRGTPMPRVLLVVEGDAYMDARARSLRETGVVNDPGFRFASVGGVVDETGLTGYYEGEFDFSGLASLHDEFAETLADALTRQLGLTLERRRAPGKVLVIRSSDRMPTEN